MWLHKTQERDKQTDQQDKMAGTGEEIGNRGHWIPQIIQSNRLLEMASVEVDVGPTGQRDADKGLSVKNNARVKNRGRRKLFL